MARFQKKGIDASAKIYFTVDPGLLTNHEIDVLDGSGDSLGTWVVKSRPLPDCNVGFGNLFKVMAEQSTTGSTN